MRILDKLKEVVGADEVSKERRRELREAKAKALHEAKMANVEKEAEEKAKPKPKGEGKGAEFSKAIGNLLDTKGVTLGGGQPETKTNKKGERLNPLTGRWEK